MTASSSRPQEPGRLSHLNTGGLMYGTVVTAVALTVGSVKGDTAGDIASAMAATVIIYWLAHVYTATLSGRRPEEPRPFGRRLWLAARRESAILGGGLPEFAVFMVLWGVGVGIDMDVVTALGIVFVLLAVEGYLTARQAGAGGWRLAAEVTGAVLFGVLIALLMAALHS
ncbi:MAG: hypothetical protein J2P32_10270 [Actinobacteria bacterium]|nr:hypothetical protein [Actinomycetota bacterium]